MSPQRLHCLFHTEFDLYSREHIFRLDSCFKKGHSHPKAQTHPTKILSVQFGIGYNNVDCIVQELIAVNIYGPEIQNTQNKKIIKS